MERAAFEAASHCDESGFRILFASAVGFDGRIIVGKERLRFLEIQIPRGAQEIHQSLFRGIGIILFLRHRFRICQFEVGELVSFRHIQGLKRGKTPFLSVFAEDGFPGGLIDGKLKPNDIIRGFQKLPVFGKGEYREHQGKSLDFEQGTAEFLKLPGEFFSRRSRDRRKVLPDFSKFFPVVREIGHDLQRFLQILFADTQKFFRFLIPFEVPNTQ